MADYKVVDAEQLDADLGTVADAIREQTGKAEQIPFPDGFASAPAELVEVGKKSAYDEFWDSYLKNGEKATGTLTYGFAGHGWNNNNFKPKYKIAPTSARGIFSYSAIELDESYNDMVDLSNASTLHSAFAGYGGLGRELGITVDTRSATDISNMFSYANQLPTIKRIIFSEKVKSATTTFGHCTRLANLGAEGTIAFALSFQWCPLTTESAKSVINCLKNYAGTDEANTKKITFSATTWGYLDAEGEASPNGTTWRDYITDSLCWNI